MTNKHIKALVNIEWFMVLHHRIHFLSPRNTKYATKIKKTQP